MFLFSRIIYFHISFGVTRPCSKCLLFLASFLLLRRCLLVSEMLRFGGCDKRLCTTNPRRYVRTDQRPEFFGNRNPVSGRRITSRFRAPIRPLCQKQYVISKVRSCAELWTSQRLHPHWASVLCCTLYSVQCRAIFFSITSATTMGCTNGMSREKH